MHLIPDTWSHFHMLVSVFPFVGLIFVLGFYVTAIVTKNEPAKRICLLALGILGILAIPTYFSGDGSIPELMKNAPVTQDPATEDRIFYPFPSVGLVTALVFYLAPFSRNNDVMRRASRTAFAIIGIVGAPTYVTGAAAMWALTSPPMAGITKAAIDSHRDMALLTLFGLAFTGATAYFELWRYRYLGRFSNRSLYAVLAFAVITLGLIAETGHRGGLINHPEIRTEALPTGTDFWSPAIENLINNVIWFVPWQTVHFFGYSLVFGTVTVVVLRVLGFWKSVPFSAVHRLLPIGVFGVLMNVFTGMLMLMAATFRYVNEITFVPKMIFLPIEAIAILDFSLNKRVWNVKAGEDAPIGAKWVAALVLISWITVIMGGRLLPYV